MHVEYIVHCPCTYIHVYPHCCVLVPPYSPCIRISPSAIIPISRIPIKLMYTCEYIVGPPLPFSQWCLHESVQTNTKCMR